MTVSPKRRLDALLVERGWFATRSRARDAVLRGTVKVEGEVCAKPGQEFSTATRLDVDDPAARYVSRAALKLIAGLDGFGLSPERQEALDIGASTGGFSQVLLERGAIHVTAVDVGHGQLAAALRDDLRVTNLENLNARELTLDHLDGRRPEFVVSDVSFISLTLALPPALELAASGAGAVLLVKPQFEAGREAIGKNGICDPAEAERVAERLRVWLDKRPGWRVLGLLPSPIEGRDGNREFLLGGVKDR